MTSKFHVDVTHSHDFGIWTHHWTIMAQYADAHDYVICVRGGKPAAVHWIRENFPAKPFALKCKVDRTVGLLFAVTDDDRIEAKECGGGGGGGGGGSTTGSITLVFPNR